VTGRGKVDQTVGAERHGTAPTGKGTVLGVRLHPDQLASLDAWIAHQPDKLSRPEALRRLADKGLKGQ
jgi:hypothetical protein